MVKLKPVRGISSVGERLIHIQEATGSKPVCPTSNYKGFSNLLKLFFCFSDSFGDSTGQMVINRRQHKLKKQARRPADLWSICFLP